MTEERTPLHDYAWTLLRVVAGAIIFTRGTMKLFGWFGGFGPDGGTAELMSRFGVAGVLETAGGVLLVMGLYTRHAAFVLSGMLAVAYFWIHVGRGGLWWWANGGTLAMLFSFVFLFLAAWGGGPYSLDARRSGSDTKT
jgi:putative oxidoreductase